MRRRGVLLVLVLAALMDLGTPLAPEASEALERFDEAAHARRRAPGPARAVSAERAVVRATATMTAVQRPLRRWPSARRSPAAPPPRGKILPALADPASSPDAH
jgi:hypothetical protein